MQSFNIFHMIDKSIEPELKGNLIVTAIFVSIFFSASYCLLHEKERENKKIDETLSLLARRPIPAILEEGKEDYRLEAVLSEQGHRLSIVLKKKKKFL